MFTTDFVLSYVAVGNQNINYKFINVCIYVFRSKYSPMIDELTEGQEIPFKYRTLTN